MHASLIVQVQSDYPKIIQDEVILVQTTNLAKKPLILFINFIIFIANSGCLNQGRSSEVRALTKDWVFIILAVKKLQANSFVTLIL